MRRALPIMTMAASLILPACTKDSGNNEPLVASCTSVLSYMPGPGQFVGEDFTALTMDEACAYAYRRLSQGKYVTLGGFGGYLVVGFDHRIANAGGAEIGIMGNATEASSEPGIVWVMEDSNCNGIPDDVWYELKGSRYEDALTRHSYSVTYYRPSSDQDDVRWTDSQGATGLIRHLSYHRQCYYPAWQRDSCYTLEGECLQYQGYDMSDNGSYWINPTYGSGYADNYDPDHMSDGYVVLNISDAVDDDGLSVFLDGIDFVKVQTGVNASSGWLGEVSTEVCCIVDWQLHLAQ